MATAFIPGIKNPYIGDCIAFFDGAPADTGSIDKAFDEGCGRVVAFFKKRSGKHRSRPC